MKALRHLGKIIKYRTFNSLCIEQEKRNSYVLILNFLSQRAVISKLNSLKGVNNATTPSSEVLFKREISCNMNSRSCSGSCKSKKMMKKPNIITLVSVPAAVRLINRQII